MLTVTLVAIEGMIRSIPEINENSYAGVPQLENEGREDLGNKTNWANKPGN